MIHLRIIPISIFPANISQEQNLDNKTLCWTLIISLAAMVNKVQLKNSNVGISSDFPTAFKDVINFKFSR
jgi:hypothetical protein